MAVVVLVLAAGYFVGGSLGDMAFKRTRRGRVYVSTFGILMGAILLFLAIRVPLGNPLLFTVLLGSAALFMPFASPNGAATVHDIAAPEVRSTALSIQYFIEQGGAAAAPLVAGLIAVRSSLQTAILVTCIGTWLLCAFFYALIARVLPQDIEDLRQLMRGRGQEAREGHVAAD